MLYTETVLDVLDVFRWPSVHVCLHLNLLLRLLFLHHRRVSTLCNPQVWEVGNFNTELSGSVLQQRDGVTMLKKH